jgi:HSP20 family protein
MPEPKTNRSENEKSGGQELAQRDRERRALQRWDTGSYASPFTFLDRMTEEMDRMFDRVFRDFGFPRRSGASRNLFGSSGQEGTWAPRIEAFQKADRFIVRADLPGLKKDDVHVELTDEAVTIRGERREHHEEEREGYYHSEREYGQFYRSIPLPEGVISESAQATFRNGVLEVSMQAAPSEANRGRRLDIREESEASNPKKEEQAKK